MITKDDLLYWALCYGTVFKVIRWGTIKLHTPNKGIEIHVLRLPGKFQAKWYQAPSAEKKIDYTTTDIDKFIQKINEAINDQNENWFNLPEDQWHIAQPAPRELDGNGKVMITPFFQG